MTAPLCRAPGPKPAHVVAAESGRSRSLRWSAGQNITITDTDQIISTASPHRRGIILQNLDVTFALYLNFGATAAIGVGIRIAPRALFTWSGDDVPVESLHVISPNGYLIYATFFEASLL